MKRRFRIKILAGYLAMGAVIMQLGPLCTIAGSTATTGVSASGLLIDGNGNFLGLINVCGQPDTLFVNPAGQPIDPTPDGIPLFVQDDLLTGCPVTTVTVPDN
ncbi:MAG: hypothetical protein MI923_30420 [Phycisphaerales bacterium]|nr:hypothetical protein [Phycisphaerales bacterium]